MTALRLGRAGVDALQEALAAENAAVYGYGVAGAHLTGPHEVAAQRDWVGHETTRDTLTAMLAAGGSRPAPAAPAYSLPLRVSDPRSAAELAARLEDGVCGAFLGLVGLTDPALRLLGTRELQAAALRAAWWRGATVAFPGFGQ